MSTAIKRQSEVNNQTRTAKITQVQPLFNAEKLIEEFRGQVGVRVPSAENKIKKREVVEDGQIK